MGPSHHVARLAARQGGIVARDQLRRLGLSDATIDGYAARGILYRLFRGVYAYGHPNVNDTAYLRAALLSCGPGAFLSQRTGQATLGLSGGVNRRAIEVTVPGTGGRQRRSDLIIHRSRTIHTLDVTTRDGLRVCTFPRLLVDRAAETAPSELEALITEGVRKRLFHPLAVEAAIQRNARRPGITVLKAAATRYRPGPDRKSGLERSFDRWQAQHPEVPDPERNFHLGIWEIDCGWREERVALELDGRPYHLAVQDFDKDRRKDTELQLMGWRPMRVSDFVWEYDRARTVGYLYAMLGITLPRA